MHPRTLNSVLQHLRRSVLLHDSDGLTDTQLLEAFLTRGEDAAFTALMRRHGPMVLGVCRRVLGNRHDAEDAFQATFLVLLRKASSIRPRQAVGHWLYGVAYRTALQVRGALVRRHAKEKKAGQMRRATTPKDDSDWRPLLDEELNRLPEKYRAPLVLCDLQGRTQKEAARELGWPQGTLSGRLWRARALLAQRLTRRGLTLSATVLTLACAEDSAFAQMAAPLIQAITKMARGFVERGFAAAAEESAAVAGLTQGVLRAMWITKVRIASALVLTVCLGAGGILHFTGASAQSPTPAALREKSPPPLAGDARPIKETKPLDLTLLRVEQLLAKLNANARLVRSLICDVQIDCHHRGEAVGLGGRLAYRKPNDVCLLAKVLGSPTLYVGCNKDESWIWCRQLDEQRTWRSRRVNGPHDGPERWPILAQPEWIMDALGIAEYDPKEKLALNATAKYLELNQSMGTLRGDRLRKVILYHPDARDGLFKPTIMLKDDDDVVLCRAEVRQVHRDEKTGAVLAKEVRLSWPKDRVDVHVQLNNFKLNAITPEQAARIFSPNKSVSAASFAAPASAVPAKRSIAPESGIQIDLMNAGLVMRRGDEVMKISGRSGGALAGQVLNDQLHTWIATNGKQTPSLRITCAASVEYATLKAVLDACRQAGIRKIEVQTPNESGTKIEQP